MKYEGEWITPPERAERQRRKREKEREKFEKERMLKEVLATSTDEEVIDMFKPVQYKNTKGILVLTDKQVVFAEEKGIIRKPHKAVFFVKLLDLAETQELSTVDTDYIKLGQFEVLVPILRV